MLIAKANTNNSIDIFRRASLESEPVVFSTDTIYGIGAPIDDLATNEKIFDIKGRDRSKPFPLLIASYIQLEEIAVIETEKQKELMETVWPAPVTLILKARPELNSLFTINSTVAVRMPEKKWLKDLISKIGILSATSANPSGKDYINDEKIILKSFANYVDYYLFDNNKNNCSSAIIDISQKVYKIIRSSDNLPDIKQFLD